MISRRSVIGLPVVTSVSACATRHPDRRGQLPAAEQPTFRKPLDDEAVERLNTAHLAFARAYNDWQEYASTLSTYSPDWAEKVLEKWVKLGLDDKWGKLSEALARL